MPAHLPDPLRDTPSVSSRVAYVLLLGVLAYAAALLAGDAGVEARTVALRVWSLAAAGLFAVATPNLLYPNPNAPVVQLLNRRPPALLTGQLRQLFGMFGLALVPALVLAYFDPAGAGENLGGKTVALVQAVLIIAGVGLDTFLHYATLGGRSQAWHEGRAGGWYHRIADAGGGVSLPRGLVPALFATVRCFGLGIALVVSTALIMERGGMALTWLPGAVVLAWVGLRMLRERGAFDRHFYQTNAFYREVLGAGSIQAREREPVTFDALYWVPARWRPATWASLRQLDRIASLGRLVAVAHLVLWILCIQGAPSDAVGGYLLLVFALQNAACAALVTREAAPPPFQVTMQSAADWWGTRTFVNLRWLAPHAASLGLVVIFDPTYGWAWAGLWMLVDAAFAVTAAGVATVATEGRFRKQFQ
jgi:hypothetical protein